MCVKDSKYLVSFQFLLRRTATATAAAGSLQASERSRERLAGAELRSMKNLRIPRCCGDSQGRGSLAAAMPLRYGGIAHGLASDRLLTQVPSDRPDALWYAACPPAHKSATVSGSTSFPLRRRLSTSSRRPGLTLFLAGRRPGGRTPRGRMRVGKRARPTPR